MGAANNGLRREHRFQKLMARRGIPLERPQRRFVFRRSTYTPDFYSPKQDCYYEVLGSRQRAHQLLAKLDLMDIMYPGIVLKLVTPDGAAITPKSEGRLSWFDGVPRGAVIRKILIQEGLTLSALASEMGVSLVALSQAAREKGSPDPRTLRAIRAWRRARTDKKEGRLA